MSQLYVLYEHASGYALFQTVEYEEITMLLPQVEQSIQDLGKFRTVVKLTAFMPFKTAANALDNINSISEGILHSDVQLFLETNVPKSKKKKQAVVLGVGDPKIGAAISEALGITCQSTGVVIEITRGIRLHFHNLVKGLTEQSVSKAQLGLGHSYSRAKVKFNINRVDNMIIQSISLLDQLDKDINTFAMRVREWYSYHFPELIKIVPENSLYAQAVMIIKNRKEMDDDILTKLEEVLMDSAKAQAILEASRSSMGMDISPIDLINIQAFASRVVALAKYRKELMEYLKSKMQNIAPNLATLIGETVGARLISHAGSLTNLAKYPASTVQILGAEKALFRALKTRGNTPKYGLIFHSTFIGKAAKQNKGRISRYLANKCSIASRIDCFSEIPTDIFGYKLKKQVEDRLKFYETGDIPPKNIDVMAEAVDEASVVQEKLLKKKKKKDKKEKKKRKREEEEMVNLSVLNHIEEKGEVVDAPVQEDFEVEISMKKKKRKLDLSVNTTNAEVSQLDLSGEQKKKKKKKQDVSLDTVNVTTTEVSELEVSVEQKKKKKKKQDMSLTTVNLSTAEVSELDASGEQKKRKKKKQDMSLNTTDLNTTEDLELDVSGERKKKKKKKKTEEGSMNLENISQNSALNSTGEDEENGLETEFPTVKKNKKKKKKLANE